MLAISVPALSLTMACALFFAASDYFRKLATDFIPPAMLLAVFVVGQIPLLGGWMLLSGPVNVSPDYWPVGLATALTGLFANLFFIMAMQLSSLSLTIPVLALIPVLTTLFGVIALNEIPTFQQVSGIFLCVVGLAWLYLAEEKPSLSGAFKRFCQDKGARYMLLVAVLWSATAPLDKISVQLSSPSMHAFIQVCLISAAIIAYLLCTKKIATAATVRHALLPASMASVTAGLAYGCQLVAYQLTLIAVVESLKRVIGLLSALLLGWLLLREPLTKNKIIGILLLIIGAPLVILSPI